MVINDNLKVDLNGFILKNPIMTASGTYGYAEEYNDFIDVSNLGAVVTKAISLYPRAGNKHMRIAETKAGMINSIGLENVGIEKFLTDKLPILKENNIEFVMNVAGSTIDDYVQVAKICEENKIKAIESIEPTKVVGISINLKNAELDMDVDFFESKYDLPVEDVYNNGASKLLDAILDYLEE